ncbi:MAG: hypothetical protein WCT52_02840 [Candidatus Micrarchaeia archaeon]|jgi:hypothetical protein
MNPGNKKVVVNKGDETKTAVKSLQAADKSFANRKNGQDERKFAPPVKSESGNTGVQKTKADEAAQFAMEGIFRSFGDYFPLEEKYCRVIY